MKAQGRSRRVRLRRRRALKLALLMLPALFWAGVFAALAGVRPPPGRVFEHAPDAAQLFVAAACLLFAAALGANVVGRGEAGRAGGEAGKRAARFLD